MIGSGSLKGRPGDRPFRNPESSRAFPGGYPAAVLGVGGFFFGRIRPTKVPPPPPLSCGGGTGASEAAPLSPAAILRPWGAA